MRNVVPHIQHDIMSIRSTNYQTGKPLIEALIYCLRYYSICLSTVIDGERIWRNSELSVDKLAVSALRYRSQHTAKPAKHLQTIKIDFCSRGLVFLFISLLIFRDSSDDPDNPT